MWHARQSLCQGALTLAATHSREWLKGNVFCLTLMSDDVLHDPPKTTKEVFVTAVARLFSAT
jgi:hypothetical protein